MLAGISGGWPMVLSNLKTLLETGEVLQARIRQLKAMSLTCGVGTRSEVRRYQAAACRAIGGELVENVRYVALDGVQAQVECTTISLLLSPAAMRASTSISAASTAR